MTTSGPGLPLVFVGGEFKALIGRQVAGDVANWLTTGSESNPLPARYRPFVNGAPLVILIRDNDQPGKDNADKNSLGLPAGHVVLTVPQGKAIDDFYLLGGDVRAWLSAELDKIRLQPTGLIHFKQHNTRHQLSRAQQVRELQ